MSSIMKVEFPRILNGRGICFSFTKPWKRWATLLSHSVEPQTHSEWKRQLDFLLMKEWENTIIKGHVDGGCLWLSCKIHFSLDRLKAVSVTTLWKTFNSPEVFLKGLPVSYHWNTECRYNQVSHRIISEEFDLTNAVTILCPCVHFCVSQAHEVLLLYCL